MSLFYFTYKGGIYLTNDLSLGIGIVFDDSTLRQLNSILTYVQKLQKQFDGLGDPLKKMKQPIVDANAQFDKLKNKVNQGTDALNKSKKAAMGLGDSLIHNVKKMTEWAVSATLLYGTIRGLQSAFKTMVDLETEAVNIAKVLPKNVTLQPFEERAIKLAKQYGQSVIDVEKATANWAKQYKNVQDVAIATQASLLAATATDIGFEQSVKSLSAIIAEWNLEAKDSIHIVDMLNEVSNNYRVTAEGVAEALAKSGSGARALGMTIEQLTGIVTTGIQALGMEGNTVGTFWTRTMARMRGNDSAIAAIKALGIDAMQPLSTLMDEIAAKWDLMTSGEKQNFAITVAGTQHWSRFTGIMDNYNTVIEATAKSYNSFNSAQDEVNRVMETTAKRIQQLNATWQEYIYRNSGVLSITKGVIDALRNLVAGLALFNPLTVIAAIGVLTVAFKGLFAAIMSTTTAFSVMTVGLLSNPWTAVIMAIGTVAGALLIMGNNANKAQNQIFEMQNELAKFDQYNEGMINKSRGIIDLANKYEIYQKAIEKAKNAGQDYSKLMDKFKVAQTELAKAVGVSNAELEMMVKRDGGIKTFVENRLRENAALINSERDKANAIKESTRAELERQLKPKKALLAELQQDYQKYLYQLESASYDGNSFKMTQSRINAERTKSNIDRVTKQIQPLLDALNDTKLDKRITSVEDFYHEAIGATDSGVGLEEPSDKIKTIFSTLTTEQVKMIELIGQAYDKQFGFKPDQLKYFNPETGLDKTISISSEMANYLQEPFENIVKVSKNFEDSLKKIDTQREKLKATGEYTPQEEIKLQKDLGKLYNDYQVQLQEQYDILDKIRSRLTPTSNGFKYLTQEMNKLQQTINKTKLDSEQQNKVIKQYNTLMNTIDGVCVVLDKLGDSTEQAISSFLKSLSKIVSVDKTTGGLNIDWKNATPEQKMGIITSGVNLAGQLFGASEEEINYTTTGLSTGFMLGGPVGAAIGGVLGLLGGHNAKKARKKFEAAQSRGNKMIEEYNKRMVDTNYGDTLSELSRLQTTLSNTSSTLSYRNWYGKKKHKSNPEYEAIQQMIASTQDAIQNMIIDLSKNLRSAVADAFDSATNFVDFSQSLYQTVYGSVKEALLNAFVSSETMKPLFNNLSKSILEATKDGMLTAEEVLSIRGSATDIGSRMQVLYQSLEILDQYLGNIGGSSGSGGGEQSYQAGSSQALVINNYVNIYGTYFGEDEDGLREFSLIVAREIAREQGRA
jgi:TP901 family phage tail tape measure protein